MVRIIKIKPNQKIKLIGKTKIKNIIKISEKIIFIDKDGIFHTSIAKYTTKGY